MFVFVIVFRFFCCFGSLVVCVHVWVFDCLFALFFCVFFALCLFFDDGGGGGVHFSYVCFFCFLWSCALTFV